LVVRRTCAASGRSLQPLDLDCFFTRAAATRYLEIRKGRLMEVESADAFFEGWDG
jgi:hypothetical protein